MPTKSTRRRGYFRDIPESKPDDDLLDLAETLISKKSGPFHPQEFHDRYVDALKQLVERKRKAKGGKVVEEAEGDAPKKGGSNVVDLMAALKKSVESRSGAAADEKAPAKKAPARKPAAKKRA